MAADAAAPAADRGIAYLDARRKSAPPPQDPDVGQIHWRPHELDAVVDEAEAALLAIEGGPFIFQRGGALVRPIRRGPLSPRKMHPSAGGIGLVAVDVPYLVELFGRAAQWTRSTRDGGVKIIGCPEIIARTYLSRVGAWKVSHLTGIIESATLRPAGTILASEGHDAHTGLWADFGGVSFPPIADNPTKDAAGDALAQLADVVSEFPFIDEIDRSIAIAAILSAIAQPSLSSMPLIGITATTFGSGKTLLADVVSLIATGRPVSPLPVPKEETEFDKVLFALYADGQRIIALDNVEHVLQSDALAATLTGDRITGRVLGSSRTISVPTCALVLVTGNNLTVAADLAARTLLCRLDPHTDRPESRTFARDLHAWIPAHRGQLVANALTFLRGYIVATDRPSIEPWGRFPVWSDLIRGALVWADYPDPLLALRHAQAEDPRRAEHGALMSAWGTALGQDWTTVRRVVAEARSRAEIGDHVLRDALIDICGERGEVNIRRLGRWLQKHAGRIHGGTRIERGTPSGGVQQWRVLGV